MTQPAAVPILERRPLLWRDGARAAALGLPPFVRAASGVVAHPRGLLVVQDDVLAVAVVDAATGLADAVALPPGQGGARAFDVGRGNKAHKLDFEAIVRPPAACGWDALALGSGSAPGRDRVARVRLGARDEAEVVEARAFYAALAADRAFAGGELNVEGAFIDGGDLVLLSRGNGAARDGVAAVNAVGRVPLAAWLAYLDRAARDPGAAFDACLERVRQADLGSLGGARLGWTDGATLGGGAFAFVAAAEASPDAVEDGPCAGSALGVCELDGSVRLAPLVDATGAPCLEKVEGLALAEGGRAWLVTDTDDAARPAELLGVAWAALARRG